MSELAYLSLGSNVGDRAANLNPPSSACTLGEVVEVSSFYETEPVEFTAQAWFLNCACAETPKDPQELLAGILEIEQQMGRRRTQKKGPRIIDIDILLFGNLVVDEAGLTIPHPAMHERRFVLEPLAEIAPAYDIRYRSEPSVNCATHCRRDRPSARQDSHGFSRINADKDLDP